jgi:hypothetical protein
LARVNVDTTVQEKNITYPTDSKLLYKAIEKLSSAAKSRGIRLRQSYVRVGKRMSVKASRHWPNSCRRIMLHLSSSCPYQPLLQRLTARLVPT